MKNIKNNYWIAASGFTLAEVLITLGIIGVVCAMTIPTLMNSIQDQQFKTAYKKAYSTASQAWLDAYSDGSLSLCTQWADNATTVTCNVDNFNAFKAEMKVAKDCGNNYQDCWNMSGESAYGGFPSLSNAIAFTDNSGFVWLRGTWNGSTPESVAVDTNGLKGPNQYGKDRALFIFYYLNSDTSSISTYGTKVLKANVPAIYVFSDFPNPNGFDAAQLNRCPSMNTHPCYYTSWITGSQ